MEYGTLIKNSFAYTKEGLLGNVGTWIMLLVLTLIPAIPVIAIIVLMIFAMAGNPDFLSLAGGMGIGIIVAIIMAAFYTGYQLKILRGEKALPQVSGYAMLFTDGIKYIILHCIYMIPAIAVFCVTVVPALLPLFSSAVAGQQVQEAYGIFMGMMGGLLATTVIAFILSLFAVIGIVRFARTGSMKEAFNTGAILATIGKIGWGTYIIALIIMAILVSAVTIVFSIIPFIGSLLQFITSPAITVFSARYICLLYESAEAA